MKKLQKRLWLIGCGATKGDLYPMITLLQQECVNTEITVLIYKNQHTEAQNSDEIWTLDSLGFQGILALLRRASWYQFDAVLEPWVIAVPWLRFLILPRPKWYKGEFAYQNLKSTLDFHARETHKQNSYFNKESEQ